MGLGLGKLRKFAADESGIALILVAIMLPVIIGFALLVIDMSRASNLQNDTQKGADALALAGAAELDGRSDSWERSQRALTTLVHNNTRFSDGGTVELATGDAIDTDPDHSACRSSGNISWCFLKSLPALDSSRITIANYAPDAENTEFIQVKTAPQQMTTIFPASFLGGGNTLNVGSEAVAGFKSGVCDYTPVFICNPYELEPDGVTLEMAATTRKYRRRQILMRGNGYYGPGNFAFLKSPEGNGADKLKETLASTKPLACYSQDGVDTEPGQNAGPVKDGLNARFGLTGDFALSAPPAANVRSGAKNIECKKGVVSKFDWETDVTKGVGLEEDSCFPNCTPLDPDDPTDAGMMGNGDWNFTRYWQVNHSPGGVTRAVPDDISGTGDDLPTRYEVYRAETSDTALLNDAAPSGETGIPACGIIPYTQVDRRVLYGAIIDCKTLAKAGYNLSGRLTDVPVRAFGSFFITEPIKDGKAIYSELVDITGKGGRGTLDNFLRNEVQLYR